MQVFWAKGYTRTSLQDLVKATGLLKGSLYGAFQSKENLFREALQQYAARTRRGFFKDGEPLEYIRNFFREMVDQVADDTTPCFGCFVMNTCVELGNTEQAELGELARTILGEIEDNFRKALAMAHRRGELPDTASIDTLAARLVGAAFSIPQISKFRRARRLLIDIATGVLTALGTRLSPILPYFRPIGHF
jgi:TetR/AcrR family transcriptional repressor of nem operon